jgi:hypothetical protein
MKPNTFNGWVLLGLSIIMFIGIFVCIGEEIVILLEKIKGK